MLTDGRRTDNDNGHQMIPNAHIDHSLAIACLEKS